MLTFQMVVVVSKEMLQAAFRHRRLSMRAFSVNRRIVKTMISQRLCMLALMKSRMIRRMNRGFVKQIRSILTSIEKIKMCLGDAIALSSNLRSSSSMVLMCLRDAVALQSNHQGLALMKSRMNRRLLGSTYPIVQINW